jgi:glutamine amidotransferase
MAPSIAIIDYGMGNRRSVEKAFLKVGAEAKITSDPDTIRDADGAVIVGVGAFPEAMKRLEERGMIDLLRERYEQDQPILGICLGLQIFFEWSDEHGGAAGLSFLKGRVHRLPSNGMKVPHIGWNQVRWREGSDLCKGVAEEESVFYHLHSFAAYDEDDPDVYLGRPEVAGETTYTCAFVTAVEKPPIYGVQFHPEKSSHQGLQLIENFVGICAKRELVA